MRTNNLKTLVLTGSLLMAVSACSKKDDQEEVTSASSEVKSGEHNTQTGNQDGENTDASGKVDTSTPEGKAATGQDLGFLRGEDFVDSNPSEALIPGNIKKFLVGERTFKSPFYIEVLNLPNAGLLADTACPEEIWKKLKATVIDKHTLIINAVKEDGYGIGYNCRTAPEDSQLSFRSFALIQGDFYYYAHCPNTDLTKYEGEGIREVFPINNGNNPKICPDDKEVRVLMQYEFDLQTELSFTLFNGDKVITQEHNKVRYNFGETHQAPCKIAKTDDQFSLSGCSQTRWTQLTKYEAWTNGIKDPPVSEGTQTQLFHTLTYRDLTFGKDTGTWQYGSGSIDFKNGNLSGSVTYEGGSPTYSLKDTEISQQILPWDE